MPKLPFTRVVHEVAQSVTDFLLALRLGGHDNGALFKDYLREWSVRREAREGRENA